MKTAFIFIVLLSSISSYASNPIYYSGSEGDEVVSLTVNGDGSASLQGSCSVVNIDRDWNTQGISMAAEAGGGPLIRQFNSISVIATQDRSEDEIELRFSDNRPVAKLKQVSQLPTNNIRCL